MRLKKLTIFHPVLLAGLPYLTIINGNQISLPDFSELMLPLFLTLVITGILWAASTRILESASRGGLITAIALVFFFYFGHFYIILGKVESLPVNHMNVGIAWGILAIMLVRLAIRLSEKKIQILTSALNQIVAVIFVISLAQIIYVGARVVPPGETDDLQAQTLEIEATAAGYGEELPDVYFIVLDEFPREDVLLEYYDYDNSKFVESLEALGFKVMREGRTNYTFTTASLPSILNFQYIQDLLGEDYTPAKRSPQQLFYYMRDNAVCRTLKSIGYHAIVFDSTWHPTATSICADEILRRDERNWQGRDYIRVLMLTSILRPIYMSSFPEMARADRLFILDNLPKIPENSQPTFTFAHILLPHRPFLFDANGELPESEVVVPTGPFERYAKAFVGQTIFTSEAIVEIADQIIAKSEVPPIIIIQSDHGPRPFDDTDVLAQRPPILNAYYLPYGGDELLYPTITPVNSLRLIFNYYFGANLPLLEDRTYHAEWFKGDLYNYQEVTFAGGG